MKAGWTFFRLELKRYGKRMPVILGESILFGLLILTFGLFAVKYIYGEQAIGKIRVGIVSMEDEELSGMLVKFIGSMDSMEQSCSFELMDEAKARKELEDGTIYAAIILPEGMIDGILNGKNIPAKVLFATTYSTMETEVFRELLDAGSRLLTVAQAGIYAADELCLELEHQEWLRETEDYLNEAYLAYALNRKAVFKLEEVNATGRYSLIQYYGAALLLVFLSFAGLIMGRKAEGTENLLREIMSARGYHKIWQFLTDVFAFAAMFAMMGIVTGSTFMFLTGHGAEFSVNILNWIRLLLIFFSMGIFIRVLIGITGNKAAGIGVSFLLLLIMMAAAGLFLPSSFLPVFMEKAGKYVPYRMWLEAILKMMG